MSVRLTLSASETPLFVTAIVNVWLAPPAVTVADWNVLVTLRWTSSTMSTRVAAGVGRPSSSRTRCAVFETPSALSVVVATW